MLRLMDGFPTKRGKKEHIPIYVREVINSVQAHMLYDIPGECCGLTN